MKTKLTTCLLGLLTPVAAAQEPRATPMPGVRLVYELPVDLMQRALQNEPDLDLEQLLARTIATVAARVGDLGTVERHAASGFTVDVQTVDKQSLRDVRRLIESVGSLELRIVANSGYAKDGVHFDLQAEKQRLQQWLDDGGRERVLTNPLAIEAYRAADSDHLRWVPRLVRPRSDDASQWDLSYAELPVLQDATVKVFTKADWNGGRVPAVLAQQAEPFLIELVALNLHAPGFTQRDLDPLQTRVIPGVRGPAVAYGIVAARVADYAAWSQEFIGQGCAIVLNGELQSAPIFRGRIGGRGVIEGSLRQIDAENLARALKAGALPTMPELRSQMTLGPTKAGR